MKRLIRFEYIDLSGYPHLVDDTRLHALVERYHADLAVNEPVDALRGLHEHLNTVDVLLRKADEEIVPAFHRWSARLRAEITDMAVLLGTPALWPDGAVPELPRFASGAPSGVLPALSHLGEGYGEVREMSVRLWDHAQQVLALTDQQLAGEVLAEAWLPPGGGEVELRELADGMRATTSVALADAIRRLEDLESMVAASEETFDYVVTQQLESHWNQVQHLGRCVRSMLFDEEWDDADGIDPS